MSIASTLISGTKKLSTTSVIVLCMVRIVVHLLLFFIHRVSLPGVGSDHHAESAVFWYRQAADQGHPKAQYNLAISHLRGFNTGLQPGEAKKFIEQAAKAGVPEAQKTLETICAQGGCEI